MKRSILIIFLFITLFLYTSPGDARVYIDITAPVQRQIPVVVFPFKTINPVQNIPAITSLEKVLQKDIKYSSFFRIISPASYLVDPKTQGIKKKEIRFSNWSIIGAELIITTGITVINNKLNIELRLFDVFSKKLLLGRKYNISMAESRKAIHLFIDEMIKIMTGYPGNFLTKIAFVKSRAGKKEIYQVDFDGYNPTPITNFKSITLGPSWGKNSNMIFYTSYLEGNPDLYLHNLLTKRIYKISGFKGINISASWSDKHQVIATSLSKDGYPDIYLMNTNGDIISRLTRSNSIDISPTWSPDGGKIAFVSDRGGNPHIYTMNSNGQNVRRLTFEGKYNTSPDWSPRGGHIVFTGRDDLGYFQIFTIRPDGSGLHQLTFNRADDEEPSWSPDGRFIVYSSTIDGKAGIYIMLFNGAGRRKLINLNGEQTYPSWSPRIDM